MIFGVVFIAFFLKFVGGKNFWSNLRSSAPHIHRDAVNYQRSYRKLSKCQLHLKFCRSCIIHQVYPVFTQWKQLKALPRAVKIREQKRILNRAIDEHSTKKKKARQTSKITSKQTKTIMYIFKISLT